MKTLKPFLSLAIVVLTTGCRPEFYEPGDGGLASQGNADFSKYVAVGSTITSGFADNALYTEAQAFAYPNLLATQLKEANASVNYKQPDINSVNGWSGGTNGRLLLTLPSCSTVAVSPRANAGESGLLPYNEDKFEVTNLSVPFISIRNINTNMPPSGTNYNSPKLYYDRITEPSSLGIASEAKRRNPTFFTVWIGYVDALSYATSGGTKSLPTIAEFRDNLSSLLDSLLAVNGSKGVVANIPYVDQFAVITNNNRRLTSTTDPARNPVRFTQAQADQYNAALGLNLFSGATGNKNYYAITTGTGTVRKCDPAKDFFVRSNVLDSVGMGPRDSLSVRNCTSDLTPRSEIGFAVPVANNAVLDASEIVFLRQQIDEYNQVIIDLLSDRNGQGDFRIGLVDMKTFYQNLTDPNKGISYGTSIIRANHPSLGPDFGGFYSLDRTNPTPKGHALIANEFIRVINTSFGANVHLLNPDKFRANLIPQ